MKRRIFSILFVLVLVLTFSLVTAVPAAAATRNVPASYATIQAAIDAAVASDVIVVAAGTYTEDLTVNTANLTIRSATGATIQLVDGVGIDIQAGATNFKLGGASGQGFTILSAAGAAGTTTTFNIQLANAPSGVEISYNTINTTGSATMGISVGAAGATGLTVSHNTFIAELNDGSIWGPKVVNVTVSNNIMTGPSASPAGGYAVQFAGVTGTSTISSNTITNYSMGVAIFNGEGTSGLTISSNPISGCTNGIRLGQYSPTTSGDMTTVTVTQNTLATNTIAIRVDDGANVKASQFTITNNNISGSITWGLQNQHTTQAMTAENNWWGSANGPTHAGNTFNVGSQGNAISATSAVDYVPWLNAAYLGGASFAPVNNTTQSTKFSSIQAAITAAVNNDTIACKTGIFTEDVAITGITGITLKSESGSTTIQLVDGVGIDIQGGASSFTLGGSSGHGFTVKSSSSAGTTFNIQLANAPASVTISYNTINTTGGASQGISVGAAGATGLTVSHNAFTAEAGDLSIWGPEMVGVTVSNNTFTGPGSTTSGWAVQFAGVTGTSTISGNTISGYGGGIAITNGEGTSGLTISSNPISGCAKGIGFLEYVQSGHTAGDMTTVTVTQNTLSTNTVGIYVGDGTHVLANHFTIKYNNISGSTTYGLQNAHTTLTVTAENNYWGTAAGAYHATTNPGVAGKRGDTVSNNVDYTPWLFLTTAANSGDTVANIVANQVPAYAQSVVLSSGWNTFSVPIGLDGQYNSWGELYTLTSLPYTVAYYFNPTTQTFVALATTSTYAIAPGEGFYIKLTADSSIPYCYSTLFSIPSRALSAGWNLIGGGMTQRTELVSCASIATTGSTAGYSHIISPAENTAAWVCIFPTHAGDFYAGEGYWAFLPIARTLGLFDLTPVTWVP